MSDTEVDGPSDVDDVDDEVDQVDQVDQVDERDSLVPYSTEEHSGEGWLRSALIVVPLILGLLVVAAIGARMLTAEIPDRGGVDAGEPSTERCWDGAAKPDEGCPVPSGRAGLRWVFPSLRPDELGCRDARDEFPRSTRPTMWSCPGEVDAGEVTILYSQLTRVDRGRDSFEKVYGDPEELEGKRLLWRDDDADPGADGDYDLVVMYAALPFAVELSASNPDALDQALDELVQFRDADDIMDHS